MRVFIFGIITVFLLIFLVDLFIFRHLKKASFLNKKGIRNCILFFHWLFSAIFIIGFSLLMTQIKEVSSGKGIFWFTTFNGLFLILYLPKIFYALTYGFLRLFYPSLRKKKNSRPPQPARRDFIKKVSLGAAALPFTSFTWGTLKGAYNFHVKKVSVPLKGLPKELERLRIIHISDLHLGNFNYQYDRLAPAIDLINAENPDLVCFTGDLVNNFHDETRGWEQLFKKINSRYGVYSILGNHDYGHYSHWTSKEAFNENFQQIVTAHKKFGFHLLRNNHISIPINGTNLFLAGVENWGHPPFPQYANLDQTLKGIPSSATTLLMSHDPDHWEAEVMAKHAIPLTLSGHTHGMQMGVRFRNKIWSPAKWKYKRWDGLYREKDQFLYVNRGLGFVGLPTRIGMPPEITLLELRNA